MPHRPSREVEALVAGRHGDPFAFLGMRKASAGVYVRAMLPDAERMAVIDTATGEIVAQGERIHPAGFFVASMPDRNAPFRYRLRVWRGGHWHDFDDIYRFPPVLGELDVHLLVEGNYLASYQKLGAHAVLHDGVEGVAFAVWAPNAQRVSLVGDFNAWDGRRMPMRKRHAGGFWELFVPGLRPGHLYKYELLGAHGELLPRLYRCAPPSRAWPVARLGAGAFPDRCTRARPVRRHRALRACRSATGATPRLEHADLQLRAPRGHQFPIVERALLDARVSYRRAQGRCRRLDALSRLQPQRRRVDPQSVRRAREPRCDRVSKAHERAGVRGADRRDDGGRGIDCLADGVAPGVCRRARFRVQMEHGVDARHAPLHVDGPDPPQIPSQRHDLWAALCLPRKLYPAVEPR